jgi:ribosomal protein S4E
MSNNGNNEWGELNEENTAGVTSDNVNAFVESKNNEEAAEIGRKIEKEEREAARKKARKVQWKNNVKNGHPTLTTTRKKGSNIFPTNENALAYMSSPSKVAHRIAMQEKRALRAQQQNKEGGSYRRKKATRKNRKH